MAVKKVVSAFELLPPEPGSGSTQAKTAIRLTLTLDLKNRTNQAFSISAGNFRLKCEGDYELRGQHRPQKLQLDAGAAGELQLDWSIIPVPVEAEQLLLIWGQLPAPSEVPAEKVLEGQLQQTGSLSLNAEISRLQGISVERMGPQGALAVITSRRELDALSLWFLDSSLRQLSAAGVERVLLTGADSGRLSVSGEAGNWISLLSAAQTNTLQRQVLPFRKPQSSFRFAALAMAEIQMGGSPFRQRSSVKIYETREDAIAEGLSGVYRIAPVEQALRDLESPSAGIRRAALEGAVDRLTEQQAGAILRQATTGTPAQQREYARLLNQLPGSDAVTTLRELAMSDDRDVAAAALKGIATSQDESALTAMSIIWETGESRPHLQTQAVSAMVASDDQRWTPLIAAWVKRSVALTTAGQTAGFGREELEAAIQTLLLRRHESACLTLQNSVSKVVLTEYQDSLLRQLVQTRNPDDAAAVRPVVTTRLRNGSVSREVLEAAGAIRAAEWGPLLLEAFWRSQENRRSGIQIPLSVVLACSSQQQIEELIREWEKLEEDNQTELVGWLARYNHPEWRRLATTIMEHSPKSLRATNSINSSRGVIQLLAEDASDESLQILLSATRNWVGRLREAPGSSVEAQNVIQLMLSQLAVFSHPECRRLLNQLSKSDIPWLRAQADDYRQNARGRSPAWRLIVESYQKKKAGDDAAAAKALEMAVHSDPFCPDALVRRASQRMHGGRFDDSMTDLRRALELTPEHEEVLSLMALVQVRQGRVDEGLAAAEELIRQIPNDIYSLYNGACTYARAAERADTTADRRSMFIARAIELLKLNNAAGHDDHEHMSTDPDLIILHDHPAWQELLEQARQNALKQPNPNN
ncbi:MAG: hypothetical protein ACKO2L_01855 [Planctomycetaceae bacterium]